MILKITPKQAEGSSPTQEDPPREIEWRDISKSLEQRLMELSERLGTEKDPQNIVLLVDAIAKLHDTFDDLIAARRRNGEKLPDYEEMVFERVGGRYIMDKQDYCQAFGINAYSGRYVYSSRPVAFFLIRAEAERYAKGYQAHNCEGCRIYTYGLGYSNNGDLPVLRALLMRMGKQLTEKTEAAE